MLFCVGLWMLYVVPHLDDVVDAVDAGEHLHLGAVLGVRVLRIAVGEFLAAERRQRAEIAAGRMRRTAPMRCGSMLNSPGVAAHELDAGEHVLHRVRERLLPLVASR